MKKLMMPLMAALCLAFVLIACKKETKEVKQDEVSQSTIAQIKALGFNPDGAQKVSEGYLVEGDIIITDAQLSTVPTSPEMIVGNEEHYRTNNLVNTSTYATIKVALNNS